MQVAQGQMSRMNPGSLTCTFNPHGKADKTVNTREEGGCGELGWG